MNRGASRYTRYSLINVSLIALILLLYIAITSPHIQTVMGSMYDRPFYRGTQKNKIAIQCAVSWNASALGRILDDLKENGCRITFCVSGEWAEKNKALILRMVDEGHEIATMGMRPFEDGNVSFIADDITQSLQCISDACGVTPKLYYSGTRKLSASSKAASKLNIAHVLCTVDLLSARGTSDEILKRALDSSKEGNIILIEPTAGAADALAKILQAYMQKGLKVTGTSDILGL